MTNSEYLREYILQDCDLRALIFKNLDLLRLSEWNLTFEKLMRNRLMFGAYRYGLLHEPNNYDRIEYIKRKINEYKVTGNDECLVDIANLCVKEFTVGVHHLKHFSTKDDHNQHARIR